MNVQPDHSIPDFWTEPVGPRLPRIALMGEFSAGKSTLANLMIGTSPLPVQVVATQLPPVWISYGTGPTVIVDLEGNETQCDLDVLQDTVPEDVAFIRFQCEREILKHCEIIDMPGLSDPNMASMVWERIMPFADGVLWCSPATQAWRQSEAAVWDDVDDSVQNNSLLILTRADMLLTDKDKRKVLKRVKSETGDCFADVLLLSLTLAQDTVANEENWARSGADDFVQSFLELIEKIAAGPADQGAEGWKETPVLPVADIEPPDEEHATSDPSVVVPRRPVLRRKVSEEPSDPLPDQADATTYMPKFS